MDAAQGAEVDQPRGRAKPAQSWRVGGCLTVTLVLSLLALAGCAKKDDANAVNFEQAINVALEREPLCQYVSPLKPGEVQEFLNQIARTIPDHANVFSHVRTSLAAGKTKLLSTPVMFPADQQKAEVRFLKLLGQAGHLYGSQTYPYTPYGLFAIRQEVAILNDAGLALYTEGMEKNMFETRKVSKICYGKLKVATVKRWTAPADMNGQRVSQVEYTIQPKDVAEWAKPMLQDLDQAKPRNAVMVLTNEGWVADASGAFR